MRADALARPRRVKSQPVIGVRIYNYAHAHRLDLHDAERHAAYLFARAGVRIAWTDHSENARVGPEQPEDSGIDFFVRIVPASMAAAYGPTPGELGQSAIPLGVKGPTPGGIANVFYDRVAAVSWSRGPCGGTFLGDVVAHELGHLLLGPHHSREGIMKASWTSKDLELAALCKLRFTSEQLAVLQQAARSLPGNSLRMAVARR